MLAPTQNWPPDYLTIVNKRLAMLYTVRLTPGMLKGAKAHYADGAQGCIDFIEDWVDTFDPRNAGSDKPTRMPFILFQRQREFIEFLHACYVADANGLVEKSRDMGATWLCCAFSVWAFLFVPGSDIGWGSRKALSVDQIGNMNSIFEKMRFILRTVPLEFWPEGFDEDHMSYMRIHAEDGNSIVGESGDDIGRGGRTKATFKDEAQPLYSKILTPTGWQTMADMTVGSKVIGPNGRARTVTQVKDCGVYDVYRVTFSDGSFADCSPNHLWTVDKITKARQRVTLTTAELAEDLTRGSTQKRYMYRVPVCAPVQFKKHRKALPMHPYLVGALLGDGSVKGGCIRITTADKEIVRWFRKLLPSTVIVGAYDGRYAYNIVDALGRWGQARSRARMLVEEVGIAGVGSPDKRVPHAYLFAGQNERLALLQGLMDTDGSASGGVASFHTSSPGLANDVIFLVQSLGGTATHNIKPDHRGFRDMHVIHMMMSGGEDVFRLKRKLATLKPRAHPPGRTIVSIALCGRAPVRCISVNAKDGLYLTDNCIVTHNSAHYEHPEMIEASLGDNTNVQIDISSVNGLGNVFHRKREAGVEWCGGPALKGVTNVFVMDWSDHPGKTQAWYDERRAKAQDDGLLHVFAQEVDRSYAASVEGVVIPAEWVKSAIDAHIKLEWKETERDPCYAGLDVADGGGDRNALAVREATTLRSIEQWGERDTGVTTRRALDGVSTYGRKKRRVHLQYDSIGVGAGVKSESNRLKDDDVFPKFVSIISWNAGAAVLNPDDRVVPDDDESPLNKDFYRNLKAQAWWQLRLRFERTHRAVTQGVQYDQMELISLPSTLPQLRSLEKELSQATASKDTRMKLLIDKLGEGQRSPNLADAVVMCYWPVDELSYDSTMAWV